jgi:ABC-type polysaccharide/polyol phosphate export permease
VSFAAVSTPPLFRYRSLIWNFAQRDLKARFKGTAAGWAWSLLVPLASLAIYSVVTKILLRARPEPFGNGHSGNYTVYLFVGLTVWSFFANTINTGVGSLLGTGSLLKKIYFPSFAPVIGSTIAIAIQSSIEFGLVFVVLLLFGNVGFAWLLAPVVAAVFFIFVTAVSFVFALTNVYFRDFGHIIAVLLQLMFYATPILYNPNQITQKWQGVPLRSVVMLNPISEFVSLFRDTLYKLQAGPWNLWLGVLAWMVAAVVIARFLYRRNGQDLAEQL